jgi:hypothetical protein
MSKLKIALKIIEYAVYVLYAFSKCYDEQKYEKKEE